MKKKSSKKTSESLLSAEVAEKLKVFSEMSKGFKLSERDIEDFQVKSRQEQLDCLQDLYDRKQYKKVAAYTNYVDFADTIYLVGMSFYALNRFPPAIGAFYKITKLKCKDINGKDLEEKNGLVISSNFYEGSLLYALGKYHAATCRFTKTLINKDEVKIPSVKEEIAMCANLYLGVCYEREKKSDFHKAELCFREVIKLYDSSKYSDKENVREMAHRALKVNLILQHKVKEVIDLCKDALDEPDQTGQTLLMYATGLEEKSLIKQLVQMGANPFKADQYGNCAYTKAMRNGNEDVVRIFLQKILKKQIKGEPLHKYIDELCSKKAEEVKQSLGEKGGEEFRIVTKEYYESEIDSIKIMGQHMDNLDSFVGDDC
ncbi:MAG: hypothetical protein J0L79_05800 [Rickettsiales bacterium]|nr:hypothetical protein [Rickettsiales bacterium]